MRADAKLGNSAPRVAAGVEPASLAVRWISSCRLCDWLARLLGLNAHDLTEISTCIQCLRGGLSLAELPVLLIPQVPLLDPL